MKPPPLNDRGETPAEAVARRLGSPQALSTINRVAQAIDLLEQLAAMKTDDELGGEDGDGMSGDDAASELSNFIEQARAILKGVTP